MWGATHDVFPLTQTRLPSIECCQLETPEVLGSFSAPAVCITLGDVFASWNPSQPEITDAIVGYEPGTLSRLPIRKREVVEIFSSFRNQRAVAAIDAIPEQDGFLDPHAVDRLLLAVHWEMQRLAEEFFHGHRVSELLGVVIRAIRGSGHSGPLRIVDVGCGIGYTIRWLAARTLLASQNIELVGMDLNSTLIREASRLAAAENLACRFVQGDAFSPAQAGHVYLSTGVIHHFRGEALLDFLRRHEHPETRAFLHFDFRPWLLAPVGSWFFHILRMRTPIARHDGVLSTARAHSGLTLVTASRSALPGFVSGIYGARIWRTPAPRVFHTLLGLRPALLSDVKKELGLRAGRLEEMR